MWWPRGLLFPLSDSVFLLFFFFLASLDLFGMCCSFQHGCTQQFLAHWAVLLHRQVVLASFCWEITGGHTRCQENVGIVRETGIVLVAVNSDLLMVGLMKSMSGTLHSSMELTMSYSLDPREAQQDTWPLACLIKPDWPKVLGNKWKPPKTLT